MKERKNRVKKYWMSGIILIFLMIAGAAVSVQASETEEMPQPEFSLEAPKDAEPQVEAAGDAEQSDAGDNGFIVYHYIRFFDGEEELTDLAESKLPDEEIVFPELPAKDYYHGIGWSFDDSTSQAEFYPGDRIRASDIPEGKELVFYAVYERTGCTLSFDDEEAGFETEIVENGVLYTMPAPSERSGLRSMGWSTSPTAKAAEYRAGKSYVITEDLILYPVRQKLYTVTFLTNTGKTTDRLKALKITGVWKEKITLPKLPVYSGYTSLGWSAKANSQSVAYKEGSTYTIEGNRKLYQVNRRHYTVSFYNSNGSNSGFAGLTESIMANDYIAMPELPEKKGFDSVGWALTKGADTAKYKAGARVKIKRNVRFYAVYQKTKYSTMQFYTANGGFEYSALKASVKQGSWQKVPKLPARSGYDSIGWSASKVADKAEYKPGDSVKVTGNIKFYAVYKKIEYCTLRFYTANEGHEYTELRIRVKKGSWQKLPQLPRRLNYQAVGWGTKKVPGESDAKAAGSSVRVAQDMKFYGCWKAAKTVQFYYRDGSKEYMSLRADVTGSSIILPTAFSPKGYTFLGWSTKPNQTSYPQYQMGRRMTVTKSMKLYAVCMKKPMTGTGVSELKTSQKYDKVFFIGDSRTYELKCRLEDQLGKGTAEEQLHIKLFCKGKMGIEWFEENRDEFVSSIKAQEGKKAVVFNLGVNDLRYNYDSLTASIENYVCEMEALAETLKSDDCDMYFMSVNPLNEKELVSSNYGAVSWKRTAKWVQDFNYSVRTRLSEYTYIDVYNYLINTGFETRDGLHYSNATYDKIYNKVIEVIDR